jgi:hypothetical protein
MLAAESCKRLQEKNKKHTSNTSGRKTAKHEARGRSGRQTAVLNT